QLAEDAARTRLVDLVERDRGCTGLLEDHLSVGAHIEGGPVEDGLVARLRDGEGVALLYTGRLAGGDEPGGRGEPRRIVRGAAAGSAGYGQLCAAAALTEQGAGHREADGRRSEKLAARAGRGEHATHGESVLLRWRGDALERTPDVEEHARVVSAGGRAREQRLHPREVAADTVSGQQVEAGADAAQTGVARLAGERLEVTIASGIEE